MEEKILDLTGVAGLANNFFGDADTITPRPELRTAGEGQMAQGIYNSHIRSGYLFPATKTATTVTSATAVENCLTSFEYDTKNGTCLLGTTSGQLFKLSNLNDTSLEFIQTISDGSTSVHLCDLETYEMNGERKKFGIYTKTAGLNGADGYTGFISMSDIPSYGWSVGVWLPPFGSTLPTITDFDYDFAASSASTTISESITAGSTEAVVVVVVMSNNGLGTTTATYAGNAMTAGPSASGGGQSVRTFFYESPAAGANTVVVTSDVVDDRTVFYMSFENVDKALFAASNFDISRRQTGSGLCVCQPHITKDGSLFVQFSVSNGSANTPQSGQEEILSDVETGVVGSVIHTIHKADLSNEYMEIALISDDDTVDYEAFLSEDGNEPNGRFLQFVDSNWAFMRTADNGFAYIMADNAVHKFDGTATGGRTGTITKNVLLFPSSFVITDALDYRSRMYFALHTYPVDIHDTTLSTFTGSCGIFVWNRISTQISATDFIELPGVREIKKIYASPDGVLKLIVISDSGLTELRQFGYNDSGGVVFPVAKTLGIGAYPQYPDGLTVAGDKSIWVANDGKVYSEKTNAVTQIFEAKSNGTTAVTTESNIFTGIAFYGSGVETASSGFRENKQGLIISYKDTDPFVKKLYLFDTKNGSNASMYANIGNVYSGVQYLPITSALRNVRIYNAPISGSGTDVIATVKLYFNQKSTATRPSGMTKTVTKNEARRGYVDFKINESYVHAVQLEVEWSETEPLSGDVYMPNIAVISYDPSNASGPDNE